MKSDIEIDCNRRIPAELTDDPLGYTVDKESYPVMLQFEESFFLTRNR